ncbi:MAG: RHS repeat domain-containing protein, partial [Planctomycetota bacterium]
DDEVVWYHANTLYSVYALSDAGENVVERYRYDAYGGCTVLDADFSSDADNASDVENPYTFTARRLDAESGLMQYRNRYYAPALGRFISRDPLGYVGGWNLYHACFVTMGRDPFGLSCSIISIRVEWELHDVGLAAVGIGSGRWGFPQCLWKGLAIVRWRCCCPGFNGGNPFTAVTNAWAVKVTTVKNRPFQPAHDIGIPNPIPGFPDIGFGGGAQEEDRGELQHICKRHPPDDDADVMLSYRLRC